MNKKNILLILIIIFAAFIRIYKITTIPPALFYDEVDSGYQASVFNQNQTDYYGRKFPIHFKSFGDYRTSLHIYSIAFMQKIIHHPDLSIRLPSALYGILSVFVLYLITNSIIPSFLLALSPWAIHYSRIGFEVSAMMAVILLGLYFWLKFIKSKKHIFIYLSFFFFFLSPYFYSTAKLFIVIIFILLFCVWFKAIKNIGFKKFLVPISFTIFLLIPLIYDTIKGNAGYRFSYISIFSMPHREQIVDTLRHQDAITDHPNQIGTQTTLISSLFHNKYQLVLQKFISNYITSFSSEFLFLKGDSNIRHGFGNHGLLYLIDFILILFGIFTFLFFDKKNKLSLMFLALLLSSPLPFSLTRDSSSAHATRLFLMLPSIIYFSYKGIVFFTSQHHRYIYFIVSLYFLSFLNFCHYYYYHYPQESAMDWNMSMKEAVIATTDYQDNILVFSDNYLSFISPFLYYYPYKLNLDDSIDNHLKLVDNESFSGQVIDDKYYFGHLNWKDLSKFPPHSIFILSSTEYKSNSLSNFQTLTLIDKKYENQEAFYLIQSNEN